MPHGLGSLALGYSGAHRSDDAHSSITCQQLSQIPLQSAWVLSSNGYEQRCYRCRLPPSSRRFRGVSVRSQTRCCKARLGLLGHGTDCILIRQGHQGTPGWRQVRVAQVVSLGTGANFHALRCTRDSCWTPGEGAHSSNHDYQEFKTLA